MSNCIDIPVVIVGGGSCGLNLSCFLSDHGIEHVLFERHPGTSILPKAHIMNQRTMEILRQHGMAEDILEKSTPPRKMSQVVWQTSLAGDGPYDRKVLGSIATWGCKAGTERHTTYLCDAPHLPTNLPLLRSEPVFRAIAEERNPGRVLFSHEVTNFEDKGDAVYVNVTSSTGQEVVYRTQYMVGADGGKFVVPKLGITMEGIRNIRKVVSTHFRADLSEYWDDRTGITHFCNPKLGLGMRSGSLLPLGPTWGRYSEEWQMHFAIGIDDPIFPRADLVPRVRELLKLPNLEVDVLSFSNWVLERVHATEYQRGRIFIAGDSAHRHPPTTGLGLNTAVQDAQNIAWKLAYVLKGKASPSLIDTYHTERQPIGKAVCDWAYFTSMCNPVVGSAIGLKPDQPDANVAHFLNMFDEDSVTGKAALAYLQYVIDGQKVEFGAHDMDLGFMYPDGALVSDGSTAPFRDAARQHYTPTTRPGHRLPHAWLDFKGRTLSTHDLIGPAGDFLLIAGREGAPLIERAQRAAKLRGVGLRVAQIVQPLDLPREGEYVDLDTHWKAVQGYSNGGGILVRPDNMVGWRASDSKGAERVEEAFDRILGLESKVSVQLNGVVVTNGTDVTKDVIVTNGADLRSGADVKNDAIVTNGTNGAGVTNGVNATSDTTVKDEAIVTNGTNGTSETIATDELIVTNGTTETNGTNGVNGINGHVDSVADVLVEDK